MVETEVVPVHAQRNYPAPPHSFALWLTDDLALRLRERHDTAEYYARIADNRVHLGNWFGWARTADRATVEQRVVDGLEQFAAGAGWHVDLCWRGETVGAMWLHQLDGEGGSSEVGYWLSAAHEGKGIVTRALRALLNHFFEERRLGRVSIAFDPRNQRSAAVVERLGLEPEAVLRRAVLDADGVLGDLAFYGLLREAWLASDRDGTAASRTRRSPPRFALCVDEELDVYLAIPEREDAEALAALVAANDAHLRPWMSWVDGERPASQRAFIENRALPAVARADGFECALIVGGRLVGAAGVHDVNPACRRGSIGYWVDESQQGKGYVTRAVEAIVARCFTVGAFDGEPFERLDIRAEVENSKSRAVPERLGFTFEGVLRRDRFNGSRYADYAVYSLLRSEWLDARENAPTKEGTMFSDGASGEETVVDQSVPGFVVNARADGRSDDDKKRPLTEEEKERKEEDRALDDALDDSFPASDPPSQTRPHPDDD